MQHTLLLRQVRPMGGAAVDVLVKDGTIHQIESTITPSNGTLVLPCENQMLLPGLVDAHAHLDKNLLGRPWHSNRLMTPTVQELFTNERRLRHELSLSAKLQSARQVQLAIAAGVTHIRSHVDIDTDAGLTHFEGLLTTREKFEDELTMQLVAFPQSGMLIRPGTTELLEEAVKLGAECIGGLDPSSIDRDPVQHLDTVFDLADRYDVEVDIHLHEPGMLGAFSVELIIERANALSLQGKVTISHAFCLGMIDEEYLDRLTKGLVDNQITIMSLGSGRSDFPPLKKLHEAGVLLCTGTDGIRDTWGPYNQIDLLERVKLLGYRSGFRRDEDIEMLLGIATNGGARLMKAKKYGLTVGSRADFLVLPGDKPAQAVIDQPPRTYVVKGGNLVAKDGVYLGSVPVDWES